MKNLSIGTFEVLADQRNPEDIFVILQDYIREKGYKLPEGPLDIDYEFINEQIDEMLDLINQQLAEGLHCAYHPDYSGTIVIADSTWFDS